MTDNVIQFPVQKRPGADPAPDIEQAQNILGQQFEDKISGTSDLLALLLMEHLNEAGFAVDGSEQTLKELCFCVESIKSLLCKYYGIDHPFHPFAEACFEVQEDSQIYFHEPKFKEIILGEETPN